jgi:hypothetical protein
MACRILRRDGFMSSEFAKKFLTALYLMFVVAMTVYVTKGETGAIIFAFGVVCVGLGFSTGRMIEEEL